MAHENVRLFGELLVLDLSEADSFFEGGGDIIDFTAKEVSLLRSIADGDSIHDINHYFAARSKLTCNGGYLFVALKALESSVGISGQNYDHSIAVSSVPVSLQYQVRFFIKLMMINQLNDLTIELLGYPNYNLILGVIKNAGIGIREQSAVPPLYFKSEEGRFIKEYSFESIEQAQPLIYMHGWGG
jgi:hypothetical protein